MGRRKKRKKRQTLINISAILGVENLNIVEWIEPDEPINDEVIQNVERYFGIIFPQDYKECVKLFNGGYPEPDVFTIEEDDDIVFSCLLSFTNEEANIVEVYEIATKYLPKGVFPFAKDPFGNLICFDYRQDTESPIITFYDKEIEDEENKLFRICDTFTELIERLHEDDQ